MTIITSTKRLIIRNLEQSDSSFIFTLLNDPDWVKYIGDRNIKSITDAENYITNGPQKSYKTHGFGLWCVQLNETEKPIGLCGFLKRDNLEDPDIGFALLKEECGKGYAKEAALACINYYRDHFNYRQLNGITTRANIKSKSLLTSLGMKLKGTISHDGAETLLYSMTIN